MVMRKPTNSGHLIQYSWCIMKSYVSVKLFYYKFRLYWPPVHMCADPLSFSFALNWSPWKFAQRPTPCVWVVKFLLRVIVVVEPALSWHCIDSGLFQRAARRLHAGVRNIKLPILSNKTSIRLPEQTPTVHLHQLSIRIEILQSNVVN